MNSGSRPQDKNPVEYMHDLRPAAVYDVVTANEGQFIAKLHVDGKVFEGSAPNKKQAKSAAARAALMHPAVNPNAHKYKSQNSNNNQQQKSQQNQQQRSQQNQQQKPQQNQQQRSRQNQQQRSQQNQQRKPQQNQQQMSQYQKYIKDGSSAQQKNVQRRPNTSGMIDQRQNTFNYQQVQPLFNNDPIFPQRSDYGRQPDLRTTLQSNSQIPLGDTYMWLQPCENYRSLRCPRSDCRFLHVTKEEEMLFLTTGKIPAHVAEQAVRKAIVDDIAPQGVRQTCKAYLNGQCNWYSCPFRHLNRQEFSQEVVEMLQSKFEKMALAPRDDYRLMSNRLVGPDLVNERNLERLGLNKRMTVRNEFMGNNEDWLVRGMQDLMLEKEHNKNQEMEQLRNELSALQQQNERLWNTVQAKSMEEERYKMMGMSRNGFSAMSAAFSPQENQYLNKKSLFQDDGFYPSQRSSEYYSDLRSKLTRQNPDLFNFEDLLNSGSAMRRENALLQQKLQGFQQRISKKGSTQKQNSNSNTGMSNNLGRGKQNPASSQIKKVNKIPTKKSGQIIQYTSRPSYQVNKNPAARKNTSGNQPKKQQKQGAQQKKGQKSKANDQTVSSVNRENEGKEKRKQTRSRRSAKSSTEGTKEAAAELKNEEVADSSEQMAQESGNSSEGEETEGSGGSEDRTNSPGVCENEDDVILEETNVDAEDSNNQQTSQTQNIKQEAEGSNNEHSSQTENEDQEVEASTKNQEVKDHSDSSRSDATSCETGEDKEKSTTATIGSVDVKKEPSGSEGEKWADATEEGF